MRAWHKRTRAEKNEEMISIMARRMPDIYYRYDGLSVQPVQPSDAFIAYHEAGHAVAAVVLGFGNQVTKVSIRRGKKTGGRVLLSSRRDEIPNGESEAVFIIAGPTAENFFRVACGESAVEAAEAVVIGGESDYDYFKKLVVECTAHHGSAGDIDLAKRIKELAHSQTASLVEENWPKIATVAEVLLAVESITGSELLEICL